MNPKGGTELQFDELKKRLPEHYWEKITITTSVPEKNPIEKGKLNILWLKNSHDQPNIQPCFRNRRTIINMIGIFLILIGILKSIGFTLIFLLFVAVLLRMHYLKLNGFNDLGTKQIKH